MIRVILPNPPAHYIADVKTPGESFIRAIPNPKAHEWEGKDFWRFIHDDLYAGLKGICVYCSSWSPRIKSDLYSEHHTSIDHFIPKSRSPIQAYAWKNYRLCRTRLNRRKGVHQDVLDPCNINDGTFRIEFTTFLIEPLKTLPLPIQDRIRQTIERFELNKDRDYVNERIRVIQTYTLDQVSLDQLRQKYPFIAQQIVSQDFDVNYKSKLRDIFKSRNFRI